MIRVLSNTEMDRKKWDDCVTGSAFPTPYALSWMLDIASPDWGGLVQGDYMTVMPITGAKKMGIAYLYPVFPMQQHGVFGKEVSESLVQEFLSAIPSDYKYYELHLNESNTIQNGSFEIAAKTNCTLSLANSYKNLYAAYSQNLKRSIKKARKDQLEIKTIEPTQITELFKQTKGKQIRDLSQQDYEVLNSIMRVAMQRGEGISVGAFKNNELLSACFFLTSLGRIVYLKGSSTKIGKDHCAMHLIMDHIISEKADRNLVLDFAGSNIPTLARFYNSFGATESVYLRVKQNRLPGPLKFLKK